MSLSSERGLTSDQRKELRAAIISAFSIQPKLEMMVEDELGESLNQITQGQPDYELAVRDLVKWAEANGRIRDLVIGASIQNPGNPPLQDFVKTSLSTLLTIKIKFLSSAQLELLVQAVSSVEDIDAVINCCHQTCADVRIHAAKSLKLVQDVRLSIAVKWLVILDLWLKRYERLADGRYGIVVFIHRLSQQEAIAASQQQALLSWLSDVSATLGGAIAATSEARVSEDGLQRIREVGLVIRGYLLVTVYVPITEDENSDRVLVKGFLSVEVDPNNHLKQNRLVPLQDLMVEESGSSGGDGGTIQWTFEQLKAEFPKWIQRSETQLSEQCSDLRDRYGLSASPSYELAVEFFLPYEYLTEPVEHWMIPRLGRLRQPRQEVAVGRSYSMAVRSSDRFDSKLLNQLNKICQEMNAFLRSQPSNEMLQAKVVKVREFDDLTRFDDVQLVEYFKQHFVLVLTCPLCDVGHQEHRETILLAMLESGMPFVLWSRNAPLPNLETDLVSFVCCEYLGNWDALLAQVKRRRVEAATEQDLGRYLALLCDEPRRLEQLKQFFQQGRLSA